MPLNKETKPNLQLTGDSKKMLFLVWLVYFCYYNKPFVVMFSKEVSLFIVLSIDLLCYGN